TNLTLSADVICFFFTIRRPPRSPLFPTRRSSDLGFLLVCAYARLPLFGLFLGRWTQTIKPTSTVLTNFKLTIEHMLYNHHFATRSEEHTSELQSRENLVCRLLLEKKKKTDTTTNR